MIKGIFKMLKNGLFVILFLLEYIYSIDRAREGT